MAAHVSFLLLSSLLCISALRCGDPDSDAFNYILGGEDVRPHLWPWMVSIRTWEDKEHICGGVLVHERLVLTAAHCCYSVYQGTRRVQRDPRSMFIATGAHSLKKKAKGESWDSVKAIYVHPKWKKHDPFNNTHDLALLEVLRPNRNANISRPVCVPNKADDARSKAQAWGCIAIGWGETEETEFSDTLKHALIPVSSQKQCERAWKKRFIDSSMLCGGRTYRNRARYAEGPCPGDSGGPLVCSRDSDTWYVLGVVSWGSLMCMRNRPAVFSNVPYMSSWVKKTANRIGLPLPKPDAALEEIISTTESPCANFKFSELRIISRLLILDDNAKRKELKWMSARQCIKSCLVDHCPQCVAVQFYPRKRLCVLLNKGYCQLEENAWTYPASEKVVYIGKSNCGRRK